VGRASITAATRVSTGSAESGSVEPVTLKSITRRFRAPSTCTDPDSAVKACNADIACQFPTRTPVCGSNAPAGWTGGWTGTQARMIRAPITPSATSGQASVMKRTTPRSAP